MAGRDINGIEQIRSILHTVKLACANLKEPVF